jgi:hypothetical protein
MASIYLNLHAVYSLVFILRELCTDSDWVSYILNYFSLGGRYRTEGEGWGFAGEIFSIILEANLFFKL